MFYNTSAASSNGRKIGNWAIVIGVTFSLASFIAPASFAQDRDRDHERGHEEHHADRGDHRDRGNEHWRHDRFEGYYGTPNYAYPPPVVYYDNPRPPPTVDFIFPLRIR